MNSTTCQSMKNHSMAFGQAAGTPAALAIKSGVDPRKVNIRALRDNLSKQGVPSPNSAKRLQT